MTVRPAKTQISLGSAQSDQSLAMCSVGVPKDPSFLPADSEDSDQTGWMPWRSRRGLLGSLTMTLSPLSGTFLQAIMPSSCMLVGWNWWQERFSKFCISCLLNISKISSTIKSQTTIWEMKIKHFYPKWTLQNTAWGHLGTRPPGYGTACQTRCERLSPTQSFGGCCVPGQAPCVDVLLAPHDMYSFCNPYRVL